jgi:hypothetical protein
LASVEARLDTAGAEICLMYALGQIRLARGGSTPVRVRWKRALNAARSGQAQQPDAPILKNLRATELLATQLIEGKEPSLDILLEAGLAELAARAQPKDDVTELLTSAARAAA